MGVDGRDVGAPLRARQRVVLREWWSTVGGAGRADALRGALPLGCFAYGPLMRRRSQLAREDARTCPLRTERNEKVPVFHSASLSEPPTRVKMPSSATEYG